MRHMEAQLPTHLNLLPNLLLVGKNLSIRIEYYYFTIVIGPDYWMHGFTNSKAAYTLPNIYNTFISLSRLSTKIQN